MSVQAGAFIRGTAEQMAASAVPEHKADVPPPATIGRRAGDVVNAPMVVVCGRNRSPRKQPFVQAADNVCFRPKADSNGRVEGGRRCPTAKPPRASPNTGRAGFVLLKRGLGSLPSIQAKLCTLNCTGLNRRPRCPNLNRSLTPNLMLCMRNESACNARSL